MTLPWLSFLAGVGVVAVSPAAASTTTSDERIVIGGIGPGGMGSNHLRNLAKRDDLVMARVCDVDLAAHHDDFLAAIRGNAVLNADITVGHRTATVVHLANIVVRMGRVLNFDPATERIVDDVEADALNGRTYRKNHFAIPVGVWNRLPENVVVGLVEKRLLQGE
ncbi:MAG TPA: hypothetical protein EYQ63_28020 [Fuerstia sp.]|nr:hypothetical protein [Fuerstiella sp.]